MTVFAFMRSQLGLKTKKTGLELKKQNKTKAAGKRRNDVFSE
jgi:hypothetical protein